jgi:hypothetical protein
MNQVIGGVDVVKGGSEGGVVQEVGPDGLGGGRKYKVFRASARAPDAVATSDELGHQARAYKPPCPRHKDIQSFPLVFFTTPRRFPFLMFRSLSSENTRGHDMGSF